MPLRDAWESQAAAWIAWVRRPGNDTYDRFHRDQFFDLLPGPGKLTVDVGCGEGRVARDLLAAGHRVVAFDGSPALVAAARAFAPSIAATASFRIDGSYLARYDYAERVERDGLTMVFHSRHRPLADYFAAMAASGLAVETLREPPVPGRAVTSPALRRWQRVPLFLHILVRRRAMGSRRID